jgi:hypothetical protein
MILFTPQIYLFPDVLQTPNLAGPDAKTAAAFAHVAGSEPGFRPLASPLSLRPLVGFLGLKLEM